MAPRVDTSERAEKLIHSYYDYFSKREWIAPIVSKYEQTKHSHVVVEEGLGKVEHALVSLSTSAIAFILSAVNTFYLTPKRRITEVASKGIEWSSSAIRGTINLLLNLSTLSIGLAVVWIQALLTVFVGGASATLDGVDQVKRKGESGMETVRESSRKLKGNIDRKVETTRAAAMVPIFWIGSVLHSFLDLVEGFLDNIVEIRPDHGSSQMPVKVSSEATLLERIRAILAAIYRGLTDRAHTTVIDPVHAKVDALIEQTKKSLVVLEVIRERGKWAAGRMESASHRMTEQVGEWKHKMEEEARSLRVSPEVILLRGIHSSTQALTHNILILKEKNAKVFGDVSLFDGVVSHLEAMSSSLQEKRDVYQVRDDLINQTREQLVSLSHLIRR